MRQLAWAQALFLAILAAVSITPATASFWSYPVLSYCKCICFSNSTIIPLYRPADETKPCLSCTRQFCVDQKLAICKGAQVPEIDKDTGTGTEGDVEARCFKRDSPRDQVIVMCFLFVVFGLLVYAAVRSKLRRSIEMNGHPTDLREWGQALLPTQLQQGWGNPVQRFREMRGNNYGPVSVGS